MRISRRWIKSEIQYKKDVRRYNNTLQEYIRLNNRKEFAYKKEREYPCYTDYRSNNGGELGLYFWQDLWGAQRVIKNHPKEHYDIGSSVHGFLSKMLMFPDIKLYQIDIRPLKRSIPGLNFICSDATNLHEIGNDSIESLSALCSFEHFGLGRYGDPIDPEACFKAFKAAQRVVKPGGWIYMSVPIGNEDYLRFNADRVFHPTTIVDSFDECELIEMSVINTKAENPLYEYDNPGDFIITDGQDPYCGLFMFRKL